MGERQAKWPYIMHVTDLFSTFKTFLAFLVNDVHLSVTGF